MVKYPRVPDFKDLGDLIRDYASLKTEEGACGVEEILLSVENNLKEAIVSLSELKASQAVEDCEPNDLEKIRALRPEGPRRIWPSLDEKLYVGRLKGALLSRLAGCTLGAPVEFWSVEDMDNWSDYTGESFPPTDYWSYIKNPKELRYTKGDFVEYTRQGINKVPVDDDVAYTLLGLLIMETYGLDFKTEDVAEAWKQYLPMAYTAEEVTLKNLKAGLNVQEACEKDNPYYQWIGADIRIDAYGYVAPGYPEKAAELAYKDAVLSHRRNGVYGAMFFAAAISAAFTTQDPFEAVEIGLTEIPKDCLLAKDIRWALDIRSQVKDYADARRLVNERFDGMSHAHTNNNACLTIFGLHIGGSDIGRVIGQTVAMGMDNDCTAATAGSMAGALYGLTALSDHWYKPFNNTIDSYLIGTGSFQIDDVLKRLEQLARNLSQA